jgi:nitrite reductase/ring-hydroxylating ferredoxin subunit
MRFQPLEKLINLHDGYRRVFKIDNLQLLLIQQDGERYLIEARCPHRDHPLEQAELEGRVIRCPLHQYRFSLVDGSLLLASGDSCRALRLYQLVDRGNELGIMLEQ